MDKHFSNLQETLKELGIKNNPERIWNIDESGILFEHSPPKVMCMKGVTPQAVTSPRGKNVTLIGCGNAAGSCIPPYYVFPGKRWCSDLLDNTCPGAAGEISETGWSNSSVFQNYMENHFMKYVNIQPDQKHLVIFDGHKSHISLTLTNWGKDHGVVFYVLPPHTSHVSQPLDVSCFSPLKAIYNIECQNYMRQNPGHIVNRYIVGELSSKAYLKALSPNNIVNGFRKTGIYPFCRTEIADAKVMPAVIYEEESPATEKTAEKPGEKFLEDRKIVAVKTAEAKKRKFVPAPIIGNLSSTKNTEILQVKPKPSAKKYLFKKNSTKPRPSSSKENVPPQLNVCESEMSVSDDDEEVCCICNKRMPPAINLAYVLEFANWAQCDKCKHWTHLKHCTKVRVIRRESEFLCPHCDPATRI